MKAKFPGFKMICIAKLKCLRLESYSVRKSIQFNKKLENVYFLISSGSKDMYCADQIFSLRCCHAIANIQTKFYGILKRSLFSLVELIWNDPDAT